MEADENAMLLQACRQGDPNAWETLIRRYQRLIYAIPRRMGLDDDAAAEVFQQVCIMLLRHLNHIEQPERIGAWLATIARRESWRLLRRAHATTTLSDYDVDEEDQVVLVDTAPLPDEVFERLERQHTVRLALATIDPRCRTLLTLLFYRPDPPAYADIATALDLPAGSVGPTRARCLKKLRQALDDLYF